MFLSIKETIAGLNTDAITNERKHILAPLAAFIKEKVNNNEQVNINFICTHNSRRSHLSQIWMKTLADYMRIPNVYCYSGGTEATDLASGVLTALTSQGFSIVSISDSLNPVYAVKYAKNTQPIIGFSKKYDDAFNPEDSFAAVMTCSQADGGCPFIAGAEKRIPITFEDPKLFDGTDQEREKYLERSVQIATEMLYVLEQLEA